MTTTASTTDQLLERIHETGYWRVLMHPVDYEEQRIPTLRRCEEIVRESEVRLRGWPYPYIDDRKGITRGDTYIQSSVDWTYYVELWRFYQSGQFVHHFAQHSDRYGPLSGGLEGQRRQEARVLNFVEVVYTTTEILEFARGLAYREALGTQSTISIEFHGANGRRVAPPINRMPVHRPPATIDSVGWSVTMPAAEIVAEAPRLAIDATMYILEKFNWDDPSRGMLEEDQRLLLERRL